MRKLFTLCLTVSVFITIIVADEFCEGFEHGYISGYKQASKSALDPLPPLCPLQPLKSFSDPGSDFEHGYTIGYREGFSEGSQQNRDRY